MAQERTNGNVNGYRAENLDELTDNLLRITNLYADNKFLVGNGHTIMKYSEAFDYYINQFLNRVELNEEERAATVNEILETLIIKHQDSASSWGERMSRIQVQGRAQDI